MEEGAGGERDSSLEREEEIPRWSLKASSVFLARSAMLTIYVELIK